MTRAHIEFFQAWMIETRSGATALNKHKGLQQFFKWLMEDEEDIDRSPMERVKQPKPQKKLIAVIRDDDTRKVLGTCKGKDFVQLRDEAIIRLCYNTGARLSEVGNLALEDLNQDTDPVLYHGKGDKDRRVRYGPKAARAISRHLRARAKHKGTELPDLWLADRGGRPLKPNGIKIMRWAVRGARAPMAAQLRARVEAGRWRHRRLDVAARLDVR